MKTLTPSQSVVERWSNVSPSQFSNELQNEWKAADTLRQTVTTLVENEQITPQQGIGILACATGQIFGYQAFHGSPSVADLFSYMDGQGQSRSNQLTPP